MVYYFYRCTIPCKQIVLLTGTWTFGQKDVLFRISRVKEEGAFEEVKQSSQGQQMHRTAEAPKLALGNKFDALRDE